MYACDRCEEENCKHCSLGNPCLGCTDYDEDNDKCLSNGGCGKEQDES